MKIIKTNRDLFAVIVCTIQLIIGILICFFIEEYKWRLLISIDVCCIFWLVMYFLDIRNYCNNNFNRWLNKPIKKK